MNTTTKDITATNGHRHPNDNANGHSRLLTLDLPVRPQGTSRFDLSSVALADEDPSSVALAKEDPSSALGLPSSGICPPTSDLRPPTSDVCPPSPAPSPSPAAPAPATLNPQLSGPRSFSGGGSTLNFPTKRRRNGVIARLPKPERDMASRMIQSGVEYKMIVDALEECGYRVTERNLSNWVTRGGYAEWQLQQELALNHRLSQEQLVDHLRRDDASDLSEVGLQAAATSLSQLLLAHSASGQLQANPAAFTPFINILCRVNVQLMSLQKYREEFTHRWNTFGKARRQAAKEIASLEDVYSNPGVDSPAHEPPRPTHPEPEPGCQTYMQYLHRKNHPAAKRLAAEYAARQAARSQPAPVPDRISDPSACQGASASACSHSPSPTVTLGNLQPPAPTPAPDSNPSGCQHISVSPCPSQPQPPSVTLGNRQSPAPAPAPAPVAPGSNLSACQRVSVSACPSQLSTTLSNRR